MSASARAAALALALVASPSRAGGPRLEPWTGGETPALAGTDAAGRPLDLRAYRGRVVLVDFWASWCEPCEAELPALAKLRAALAGRPFEVLTVDHGEGPERVATFLRERGLALPVLLDRDRSLSKAWGVGGLPMAFLVDAEGRVRGSIFGECDWSAGEPAAAIARLLDEAERRAAGAERSAR